MGRLRWIALFSASLLLVLSVPLAQADPATVSEEPFPDIPSLRGNVTFWKQVFAVWGRDKAAIHDLRYPGIVYEVVALPGPIEERYTEHQQDFLEDLRGIWESRLLDLEKKIEAGKTLDNYEKALALKVTDHGGSGAIIDAHKRVRSQRGIRERFKRSLEISRRYDATFRALFRSAGLPEDLAHLPHVESSFDARARSSAGALGMWQFTKGTGRKYMRINSAIDERLDPVAAARGAARYMQDAFDRLGDWPTALTSYNHGVAGMARAKAKHGNFENIYNQYQGRSFGFASKNFYAEFLAVREITQDPEAYFPNGLQWETPLDLLEAELAQRTPPSRIALAYAIPVDTLASINPGWNDRTIKADLALPTGTRVRLPSGTIEPRADAAGDLADAQLIIAGLVEERATHRVRKGENLTTIAGRYGMGLDDLCDLNGIDSRRPIHVGQKLTVTTGRMSGGDFAETYTVNTGDTLGAIAAKFEMPLDLLRSVNGMGPRDSVIRVGQKLQVRDSSRTHVVRHGDTLLRIAGRYGVRISELLRVNRLNMGSVIRPGQSLQIPSATR